MKSIVRSDGGRVRKQNEDTAYVGAAQSLLAVADGMGGHKAGEVASYMAIDTLKQRLRTHKPDLKLMRLAFEEANRRIADVSKGEENCHGMGTTMTALWKTNASMLLAHVGDSRAYLLRDGILHQVTDDHSVVAELMRSGLLTPEEARKHPYRNVITRALGSAPSVEVDLREHERHKGDIWLLCTDGLSNMLSDQKMQEILSTLPPDQAADELLHLALEAGGTDNITFILALDDEEVNA